MYRRKEHPIIEAVMLGDTYIVEELLEKGSNIDQENKFGNTLLQIALDKKDYEMMPLKKNLEVPYKMKIYGRKETDKGVKVKTKKVCSRKMYYE